MVRCAGVRAPPKTSAMTRSAQPSGILPSPSRASPPRTRIAGLRVQRAARSRTSWTSGASISTTCWVERGRVAAVYRARVKAPPPRCTHAAAGWRGGRGEVDDVAEPALVGEGEVRGVVEVHVGLRGAVEQQRPAVRALTVGYELGEAAVDRRGDGLLPALGPLAVAPRPGPLLDVPRALVLCWSGRARVPAAAEALRPSGHYGPQPAVVGRLDEPGRLVEGGAQDGRVGDRGRRRRAAAASRRRRTGGSAGMRSPRPSVRVQALPGTSQASAVPGGTRKPRMSQAPSCRTGPTASWSASPAQDVDGLQALTCRDGHQVAGGRWSPGPCPSVAGKGTSPLASRRGRCRAPSPHGPTRRRRQGLRRHAAAKGGSSWRIGGEMSALLLNAACVSRHSRYVLAPPGHRKQEPGCTREGPAMVSTRAVPNLVFRRLRGQRSAGEFAAAVRRAAREIGEQVACDARYIGRVESGEIRCPNYAYERVFLHMFPGAGPRRTWASRPARACAAGGPARPPCPRPPHPPRSTATSTRRATCCVACS